MGLHFLHNPNKLTSLTPGMDLTTVLSTSIQTTEGIGSPWATHSSLVPVLFVNVILDAESLTNSGPDKLSTRTKSETI